MRNLQSTIQYTGIRVKLILILIACPIWVNAQSDSTSPIPVELMQGHQKLYSFLIVNRSLAPESDWGFLNVTTFSGTNPNKASRNEFFSSSLLTYPVYRKFRIVFGVNLNEVVGLNYFAGFQYATSTRYWLIVLVPGIYYPDQSSVETLALIEYRPPLSKRVKLYTRLHTLYNASLSEGQHNRSYGYLRLGLSVKTLSFGVGWNVDWYGQLRSREENLGIFIRTELP